MFWSAKKSDDKNKKVKKDKRQKGTGNGPSKNAEARVSKGTSKGRRAADQTSEDIRAEALANAKAAREHIGEDTLDRIAEAMRRKQSSPLERAKATIEEQEAERVALEILDMLETRH